MVEVHIKKETFEAKGVYMDGKVVVFKGSTINPTFASYIKGTANAKKYRNDPSFVDSTYTVRKDIEFSSPSTAAQFVMGQSRDGYDAWKTIDGESLGKHLEIQGIRERNRRKKD